MALARLRCSRLVDLRSCSQSQPVRSLSAHTACINEYCRHFGVLMGRHKPASGWGAQQRPVVGLLLVLAWCLAAYKDQQGASWPPKQASNMVQ